MKTFTLTFGAFGALCISDVYINIRTLMAMIFTFFRFIKGLVWSWTSNKISTSDPWHKKQEWELTSQIKEICLFLSIKDWVLHQDMPYLLEWGRFHLLSICGSSWIELAIKSITIRSNLKEKKIFFQMIYLKVFSYFLAITPQYLPHHHRHLIFLASCLFVSLFFLFYFCFYLIAASHESLVAVIKWCS